MVVNEVRTAQDPGHGTRPTPDQMQFANARAGYSKDNPHHDNDASVVDKMKDMVLGSDSHSRGTHERRRSIDSVSSASSSDAEGAAHSPRAHARPNSTKTVERAINNPHAPDRKSVRPVPGSGITPTHGSGIASTNGAVIGTGSGKTHHASRTRDTSGVHDSKDASLMQKAKRKVMGDGTESISSASSSDNEVDHTRAPRSTGTRGINDSHTRRNNEPSMVQKVKNKVAGDGTESVSSASSSDNEVDHTRAPRQTGSTRISNSTDTFNRNNITAARALETVPMDNTHGSTGATRGMTTEAAYRTGHHSTDPMADYNARSEMKDRHQRGPGTDGPMTVGLAATAAAAGTPVAVGRQGSNPSLNNTAPPSMRNTTNNNPHHARFDRAAVGEGFSSDSSMSSVSSNDDLDLVTRKRNAHRKRAARGSVSSVSSKSSASSASSSDEGHSRSRNPVGGGEVIIPSSLDEAGGTPGLNTKPSLVSQRAMALAGGQAALGVIDVNALSRSKVSFRREIPIEVHGDKNPNAYVTSTSLLSQARKTQTINALTPIQPSQVLPSNSTLDKALLKANKYIAKAHLRAEKNAAKESRRRDKEVDAVEKRLLKEIAHYSKQMYEDEETRNPVRRHSLEEWELEAKRVKWPLINEYDRALSKSHLDAMKLIYRMRLLDSVSVYERMHAAEWSEVCEIENQEWHDLEKEVDSDKKEVDKDTKWGIGSKITGHKKVDGVKLDKEELEDTADAKKRVLSIQNTARVDKLRNAQMQRRAALSSAQEKSINTLVKSQSDLMNNMRVHVLT